MSLGSIKDKLPINWNLIANPVNWVVVFLMVALAGAAFVAIPALTGAANQENE